MTELDCLIISNDKLTSDTQQFNWDKLNTGWNDFYGWQWAQVGDECYALDNLLNRICHETEGLADLISTRGKFDHFQIPQLNGIYLLNYLRKNGFFAKLLNHLDQNYHTLLADTELTPKCIAISSTFHLSTLSLRNLVSSVREIFPDSVIVVGGSYVNIQAKYGSERHLKDLYRIVKPDYLVIESQGERTLKALLSALKNNQTIAGIKNLFYVDHNSIGHYSGLEPEDNSLDNNYIRWGSMEDDILYALINIQASKSCPNRCSYCTFPELMGKYGVKSLNVIELEFKEISKKSMIQNVIFVDDTLNVNKQRFRRLCHMLQRHPFGWYSFLRCDNLDSDTVRLMKESGCKGVFVGFESGDDRILKNMNKRVTVDKYKHGLELLKKNDIVTFGSFILGFPGETETSLKNTYDLIENHGLDFYAVNGWTYFTFAPISKRKKEFQLKGKMNAWSHYSMNSIQTAQFCKDFFASIKNSVFMPSNTASGELWDIAYLISRGFTLEEVKGLFNCYKAQINLNLKPEKSAMAGNSDRFNGFINILTNLKERTI